MTVSLLWLNDYLKTDLTPEQLGDVLTSIGLEVERIEQRDSIMGGLAGIIAGKVLTCEKHPDADRLSLTTVDVGKEKPASIVCGANNIATGQTVWVALPETTLFDTNGKPWTIKVSKIRGALSEGMICAEDELGLGENHEGIIILPDAVQTGSKASNYYKVTSDTIFEIGLTPNRSDATSIIGIAEDLAAYLSIQSDKVVHAEWPVIEEINPAAQKTPFKVSVINNEACPRYSGIIISNITVSPSPEWIQKRLQSIGLKTINNIVDITNFVLHEMGQPLHAFDADKISGDEIRVQTKPSGTPFLALDGQTYSLYHEDLIICDGVDDPMCIGGVYGGLNSGVSNTTTRIFLEAAHFNTGWVRRTSMRHNLRTEAARRFEKGSDPNLTVKALARAANLISTYGGGIIASEIFDIYPNPITPALVTLNFAHLNATTGVQFKTTEVFRIMHALNMQVVEKHDYKVVVAVPTNKADVLREIDVIEEILRIYGFSNVPLPGKMHTSIAIESKHVPHRMRRLIGQVLSSRGFAEAMNMSLTQPAYYKEMETVDRDQWVTIHNTSNESLNLMRPEMIVPMLETLKRNINRKQEDIRLFEFGKSYLLHEGVPVETEHLLLTVTGNQLKDHWQYGSAKAVDFYNLKSEVDSLLTRIGIRQWLSKNMDKPKEFSYGLEYKVGSISIVRFGAVSKKWSDKFDIRQNVFVADFNFDAMINLASQSSTISEELNRFPPVERDLAIVIPSDTSYEDVQNVVLNAGDEWLTNVQVFDLYTNPDHLGPGKLSMALRFTIEKKEGTLTDKDIEQWLSKVQKALVSEVKAEIRK